MIYYLRGFKSNDCNQGLPITYLLLYNLQYVLSGSSVPLREKTPKGTLIVTYTFKESGENHRIIYFYIIRKITKNTVYGYLKQ